VECQLCWWQGLETPYCKFICLPICLLHISALFLDHIAHTTYVQAVYCYWPSSVVCRSVCWSVCVTLLSPANTAEPIMMPLALWAWMGPRNHVLHGGSKFPMGRAILGKRDAQCKVSAMSCAKMAEPIDLLFGLWTRVGRRKHKFNHICQVAPMCPDGRARWRHLANTTEPSICGCNAVLYQIILTTCSITVSPDLMQIMNGSKGSFFYFVFTSQTYTCLMASFAEEPQ